jgi:hypothetical protein
MTEQAVMDSITTLDGCTQLMKHAQQVATSQSTARFCATAASSQQLPHIWGSCTL